MTVTHLEVKPSRVCGDCRLCCRVLEIYEIFKTKGEWCPHACSTGCSIYERRPGGCASFECLWLMNVHTKDGLQLFRDDERPDKTRVVFCPADDRAQSYVVHPVDIEAQRLGIKIEPRKFPVWAAHEGTPGAIHNERSRRILDRLIRIGIAVAVNGDDRCHTIYFPDGPEKMLEYKVPPGTHDAQLTSPPGYDEAKKAAKEGRGPTVWKLGD